MRSPTTTTGGIEVVEVADIDVVEVVEVVVVVVVVCDVVVVSARYWDVFCIAGKEMNKFLVVGDNNIQVFERPVGQGLFNDGDCRSVLFGESQLSYMEKENLGFHMWREVLPLYHQ